jgi:hypothetical protein
VLVDKGQQCSESDVDTGETGLSTALAPRNETLENSVGVDDGAAGVSRAGVLATLGQSGAEHVGGDDAAVLAVARSARDDRDGDLVQSGGERVGVLAGGAPIISLVSNSIKEG